MKNLLVPFDFSQEAKNALKLAVQITQKHGGMVTLLHVIDYVFHKGFNTTGEVDFDTASLDHVYMLELISKVRQDLTSVASKYDSDQTPVKTWIRTGGIYDNIVECIERTHSDMVVMGSKGISGFKELLIGSNTEKVVRYALCPVLTVKNAVDLSNIKKIVFATDLSTDQKRITQQLNKFVNLLNLELTILKINTHNYLHIDPEILEDRMREYAKENQLPEAHTQLIEGDYVEESVLNFAKENDMDVIAIGTHGRTGIAHFIAGSMAEDLTNHAKKLVWTCTY